MEGQSHGGSVSPGKASKRYREEHVNGLSQKELILMLYDGAIKYCSEARDAIMRKDFVCSCKATLKARDIVTELLRILNMDEGGEVAENLKRLYFYVIGRLIEVNFAKEISLLDNVLAILNNLRSAWAQIDFEEALAGNAADNGDNGGNGADSSKGAPRQHADEARFLSVTA